MGLAPFGVIDPVAWSVVDAAFGHRFPNRLGVAEVPLGYPIQAGEDTGSSSAVFESVEPIGKDIRSSELVHAPV